jgi:hypothetical protein
VDEFRQRGTRGCYQTERRKSFLEKLLDTIEVTTLYKSARTISANEVNQTMTSMKQRLHNAERRPSAQMRAAWCGLVAGSTPTNFIGDQLGQRSIVDSRYIRH